MLSARELSAYQSCARRWKLEQDFRLERWHPKTLFDSCIRRAVLDLSSGLSKEEVSAETVARFREVCVSPGLDVSGDTWTLAQDYCSALRNVVEFLGREALPKLKLGPKLSLGLGEQQWQVLALAGPGRLHRWTSVERLTPDVLSRELHSWYVFGDIAASGLPMTLHILELGSHRGGRRHSHWCRAFKHPVVANHYRFRARDGSALRGQWKSVWMSEMPRTEPSVWVDLMLSDNLKLVHEIQVQVPATRHLVQFVRDVDTAAQELAVLPRWESCTMSRGSCDLPYSCPWQGVCYSSELVSPLSVGAVPVGKPQR